MIASKTPEKTTTKKNTQSDSMSRYNKDMKRFDLLTREEEIELAERIQKGDPAARERMINSNLRLVAKIANCYSQYGMAVEDLVSEGNIGLMKAADRFDPTYGVRFSTYSAWWIKQCIMRALGNQSRTIRLPLHLTQTLRSLDKISREMALELGHEPSDDELAEHEGLPPKRIAHMREVSQPIASLDIHLSAETDEPCHLGSTVQDESAPDPAEAAQANDLRENLGGVLRTLNQRERQVVVYRFGLGGEDPQTLEEVGKTFGVTRERIRQIQKQAMEKLRHALKRLDRIPTPNSPMLEAIPA